jgi:hypothetical protein
MSLTRRTEFDRSDPKFRKAVKGFGQSSAAEAIAVIEDFETDWKNGMEEPQLRARYHYKEPHYKHRPYYHLFQIYVGANRKSIVYRAIVMFFAEQEKAAWIHAFKKEGDSEPQEIKLAVDRADEYWRNIHNKRKT